MLSAAKQPLHFSGQPPFYAAVVLAETVQGEPC
jgi:hypothetical protein